MSKEEVLSKHWMGKYDVYAATDNTLKAMDEYARIDAIAFLKWYAEKMLGFIEYLRDIKPIVTSNEIEEKLLEFEGKDFNTLYELYSQSKNTNH